MANSQGSSNTRNIFYNGKHPLLPPKSPFPSISPSYADYVPMFGPKGSARPREGNSNHQRTSSESHLLEEQPSWLDELLNEPETPVRRGHRRSSSDSFAYLDASNAMNLEYVAHEEYRNKNINSAPSWGAQDFDHYNDVRQASLYKDVNAGGRQKNRAWDSSLNSMAQPSGLLCPRDIVSRKSPGRSYSPQEADEPPSIANEKHELYESGQHDPKTVSEKKDSLYAKSSASETDTKRAKQQFAQRSRVRKLQYIAELERNVQALQAEGSEVSAELEFLNQQNLILSMENKTLKQRLESLAQEQLIKYLEHEVLEREIGRLRALYQQQQQPQQQQLSSSGLRRTSSRDLDSQFANLSLKHKDTPTTTAATTTSSSGRDPVSGPLLS